MKTLFTIALSLTTLFAAGQSKPVKLIKVVKPVIIAYHLGNVKEVQGMFIYAHAHHLHFIKSENINNIILNYWN